MTEQKAHARGWDIIEKTRVGMLTTRFAGGLRARPLEPRPDRDEGVIYFVTDVRGAKDDEIEAAPDVCLIIIEHADKAYLSITGCAEVCRDEGKAAAIWKKTDDMWWPDGPADPNVRVLRLVPERAGLGGGRAGLGAPA